MLPLPISSLATLLKVMPSAVAKYNAAVAKYNAAVAKYNAAVAKYNAAVVDASCSNSVRTYWWGEDWMSQGTRCLLLSLASSTDKVRLNK